MNTAFTAYLLLGFDHLAGKEGLDHILFILSLCAVYRANHWLRLIKIVTAFTIGHSITLILAGLGLFIINPDIIEWIIPVTIIFSATSNLIVGISKNLKYEAGRYMIALFFGTIHGLAFSSFFNNIYTEANSLIIVLLGFNIGLEFAQILIVVITIAFIEIQIKIFRVAQNDINLILSVSAIAMSILIMIQKLI